MSQTMLTSSPVQPHSDARTQMLDPDKLEQAVATSQAFAWSLIVGLPVLGMLASVLTRLPLFAALMAGCFLLATALTCRRAIATFTGKALRLLVTARLVLVVVLGALLFCTTGVAQLSVVSAVVLWLAADRLLGRRALYDLFKAVRGAT